MLSSEASFVLTRFISKNVVGRVPHNTEFLLNTDFLCRGMEYRYHMEYRIPWNTVFHEE
jgi:hypothetical protein